MFGAIIIYPSPIFKEIDKRERWLLLKLPENHIMTAYDGK